MDKQPLLSPEQLAEWFPRQLVSITEPLGAKPKGPAVDSLASPLTPTAAPQASPLAPSAAPQSSPMAPAAETPEMNDTTAPAFLGQNQKKILVLVNEAGFAHTADAHLDFLVTVLQACQLGLADIALVNLAAQSLAWPQLVANFQPKVCLLFQVDHPKLGLPFVVPPYRVYAHGETRFLLSAGLSVFLQADAEKVKAEKKLLWGALKTIFKP